MLKGLYLTAALAAASALGSSSASASAETATYASLTAIQGQVFVDIGKGFVPVKLPANEEALDLKLGDRVLVAKDGAAVMRYGPSCSVPLEAPSMVTVKVTTCVASTQGDQELGAGGRTRNIGPLIIEIAPLIGSLGLLAGSAMQGDNDENPVSP
jgi:hypothetical protein